MTVLRILVIRNPIILSVSLIFNIAFAQQTEIDGKLKVKGEVDVSGNRITNIGGAITAGDAINAQNLQDALWDEGPFQTTLYNVYCSGLWGSSRFACKYKKIGDSDWSENWETELNTLSLNNWIIYKVINFGPGDQNESRAIFVMKKKIEE